MENNQKTWEDTPLDCPESVNVGREKREDDPKRNGCDHCEPGHGCKQTSGLVTELTNALERAERIIAAFQHPDPIPPEVHFTSAARKGFLDLIAKARALKGGA